MRARPDRKLAAPALHGRSTADDRARGAAGGGLALVEPQVDEQEAGGFNPDRPPALDVELAVDSAIDLAFTNGGKAADQRANVAIGKAQAALAEKLARKNEVEKIGRTPQSSTSDWVDGPLQ